MERHKIMAAFFRFGQNRPIPTDALAAAEQQKQEITPILLESLDVLYETVMECGISSVSENGIYDISHYAMFLLAKFREKQAHSKLLRILTMPSNLLILTLDDILTESIGSILLSTYDGDLNGLQTFVRNKTYDSFARAAVLDELGGLMCKNVISREIVLNTARDVLRDADKSKNGLFWGDNVLEFIEKFDLYELVDDVRRAYRDKQIDFKLSGYFETFFDRLYNESGSVGTIDYIDDVEKELKKYGGFLFPTENAERDLQYSPDITDTPELQYNYPPTEDINGRPGLLHFYDKRAVEIDHLIYKAANEYWYFVSAQESTMSNAEESIRLFLLAFNKMLQVCKAECLTTITEYDERYEMHYNCSTWLKMLTSLLKIKDDKRYHYFQSVLETKSLYHLPC